MIILVFLLASLTLSTGLLAYVLVRRGVGGWKVPLLIGLSAAYFCMVFLLFDIFREALK